MPCFEIENGIICVPSLRRFRWRNKYYNVEAGYLPAISDMDSTILDPEEVDKKTKRKFYKELNRGV